MADRVVAARLSQALALLDVRVLNHLVIGGNTYLSIAARCPSWRWTGIFLAN